MIISDYMDLISETEKIQQFTDEEYEHIEDPQSLVKRGDKLSAYVSRTGVMFSDAKYYLNEAKKDEIIKAIKKIIECEYLSAKVQNSLIDSICKEKQKLVDQIEQLNKTCKYQLEWCRSKLSMAKEEMYHSRTFNYKP